jgi:electron transfer flavoprotein alpha subunit
MSPAILVFSDDPGLLAELEAGAQALAGAAGWTAIARGLDAGDDVPDARACTGALAALADEADARLVLVGATRVGMEVAPRLAERREAGYAAWAQSVELDAADGVVTATCMLFAGTGAAEYRFAGGRTVLSVGPGIFEAGATGGPDGVADRLEVIDDPAFTVLRSTAKPAPAEDLEHSRVVVDCGRGVATLDDLEMARKLAAVLGGQTACSRPLASERDWFADWLGLSGMRIEPELCLTLGISGSVQHLIGIRDARVIAAVNNDEDAAIFTQADLGVVADLREFLPALIERLEARGARPVWGDPRVEQPAASPVPAVAKED